ncbi:MAG: sulfonate ABC transporter permease [Coxiella sp. (in: Bacteria)]|nr:MAG: sulfonate ABC transporter permease [Coxiella sp. (in: g-proteobacteria)]
MPLKRLNTYAKNEVTSWPIPNYWDLIALVFVLAIIFLLGWGGKAMVGPYDLGQKIHISLNPWRLPYYALRTVVRMLIAMCCSLAFTFIFGTWAAKSRHAERIIIPMIDIGQSVPVLGFLSIAVANLTIIFKGSMLGPELAAIFAIFTAQVWNMALSFYQSLKTLPEDLTEAARMFRLSPWQKFWKIEVPFAMPGLLWNTMMSMSGSWVFLVASEAITVANQNITLPGVGSYIALAIERANFHAVLYVIVTMFIVIGLYDQIIFRPLVAWAEKFKAEEAGGEEGPESWVLTLFQRTFLFQRVGNFLGRFREWFVNAPILRRRIKVRKQEVNVSYRRYFSMLWNVAVVACIIGSVYVLFHFIYNKVSYVETWHVLYLGFITAVRVVLLIIISSIVWVPIGVWIGLHPKASAIVQPIAQFFAAFPANLLYPLVVIPIVLYHLNVNIWTSPLMILGTQWYILFNVIAGTSALPKNLKQAVGTLNVKGWLWWKRFILPGIFPYYVTGAITAAGGAWNMSIIAEAVSWGKYHLYATGLGAYIAHVTTIGDFPREALGIAIMSAYVLVFNHIIWRPLYNLAEEKFQIR